MSFINYFTTLPKSLKSNILSSILQSESDYCAAFMNVTFGALIFVAKWAVTRKNPLKKERGMDFWFDMIDWLAIPMNMLGRRRS